MSNFLDLMYSSFLLPHIASPTHTIATSATLIENIFTNATVLTLPVIQ